MPGQVLDDLVLGVHVAGPTIVAFDLVVVVHTQYLKAPLLGPQRDGGNSFRRLVRNLAQALDTAMGEVFDLLQTIDPGNGPGEIIAVLIFLWQSRAPDVDAAQRGRIAVGIDQANLRLAYPRGGGLGRPPPSRAETCATPVSSSGTSSSRTARARRCRPARARRRRTPDALAQTVTA